MARRLKSVDIHGDIKRVVIYVRYSNLGGRHKDSLTTLDTQESECRALCNLHKWQVVKVLADPGRSAYKKGTPRPEYDEAMRMVTTGQVDAIVVWKVDRFTRSLSQFHKDWQRIDDAGKHFVSVIDRFDTSDTMGRMMLNLVVGFAEMESEMKSDRAIPMHNELKKQGKVGPGPRPYGYKRTNSVNGQGATLTEIKKEGDLLRTAAEWIIGGNSLTGFIHHYQPESSQANKKMTYHGLRSALISPTTAGLRIWDGSPDGYQKGNWSPIIDRETWDLVCKKLTDPNRRVNHSPTVKSYLLSGLMVCPKCNKNVHARGWKSNSTDLTTKRYACPKCYCSVDMAAADPVAVSALFDAVPESKWQSWQTSGLGWDTEVIADIESRLAAVDKQFSLGKIKENRWLEMTGDLQAQLEACETNEPLDIPMIPNLREGWDDLILSDKHKVFRQAFSSIEILPASGSKDARTRMRFNER